MFLRGCWDHRDQLFCLFGLKSFRGPMDRVENVISVIRSGSKEPETTQYSCHGVFTNRSIFCLSTYECCAAEHYEHKWWVKQRINSEVNFRVNSLFHPPFVFIVLRGTTFICTQTKNRSVCENAVTGILGSFRLLWSAPDYTDDVFDSIHRATETF